jgi:Cytochrome C biogenesis protein transmembrane region
VQDQVTFFVAFLGGTFSFLSPCVLPLFPSYLSFITGMSFEELSANKSRTLKPILENSLLFISGFSLAFIAMGASAGFLGGALFKYRDMMQLFGGLLVIFFGLYIMGMVKLDFLGQYVQINMVSRPVGAFGSVTHRGGVCGRLDSLRRANPRLHPRLGGFNRTSQHGNPTVVKLFPRTRTPVSPFVSCYSTVRFPPQTFSERSSYGAHRRWSTAGGGRNFARNGIHDDSEPVCTTSDTAVALVEAVNLNLIGSMKTHTQIHRSVYPH